MKGQKNVKSDNTFIPYLLILVLGGIGMLTTVYYIISSTFDAPYPQLTEICLGGLFGIFGLISIVSIYSFNSIEIYSDHFKVISIFGKTKKIVYLGDISHWIEIEKENKEMKWYDLIIFTPNTKVKVTSLLYKNYPELKRSLVKKIQRDILHQRNWHRKRSLIAGVVLLLVGGIVVFSAYFLYSDEINDTSSFELHTITDIIINKAEISAGAKGSRSVQIKLKKYPTFKFDIAGVGYEAMFSSEYVSNVKIGDTLKIEILKDDYQMKLAKEKPLGFWDKTIDYFHINVYGLRDKKSNYLSLSDYIDAKNNDMPGFWILVGFLGMFISGSGSYKMYKNWKPFV